MSEVLIIIIIYLIAKLSLDILQIQTIKTVPIDQQSIDLLGINSNEEYKSRRYNIEKLTEDFFIPVRGGDSGTQIEGLPGLTYEAVDDIEYLRNKLLDRYKLELFFSKFCIRNFVCT